MFLCVGIDPLFDRGFDELITGRHLRQSQNHKGVIGRISHVPFALAVLCDSIRWGMQRDETSRLAHSAFGGLQLSSHVPIPQIRPIDAVHDELVLMQVDRSRQQAEWSESCATQTGRPQNIELMHKFQTNRAFAYFVLGAIFH